jgi:hypothetical protein
VAAALAALYAACATTALLASPRVAATVFLPAGVKTSAGTLLIGLALTWLGVATLLAAPAMRAKRGRGVVPLRLRAALRAVHLL